MLNCDNIQQLRASVKHWREQAESIAFVPTMGNLHAGHLSLVKLAQQEAERVVVSIYVNPMQFAPEEDFASYPRTLDDDLAKLKKEGVDLVFLPNDALIYPYGERQNTYVQVPGLSDVLEGEFRPGFFKGVATVVLKLFNMVQPDYAVFGEKDFQQLLIIKRMVEELNLPVEIIAAETEREADGLAMSSRNVYLSTAEREKSQLLSSALKAMRHALEAGSEIATAEADCIKSLKQSGFMVDYVSLRETTQLSVVSNEELHKGGEFVILAAAKMGKTRLIDNLKFNVAT